MREAEKKKGPMRTQPTDLVERAIKKASDKMRVGGVVGVFSE